MVCYPYQFPSDISNNWSKIEKNFRILVGVNNSGKTSPTICLVTPLRVSQLFSLESPNVANMYLSTTYLSLPGLLLSP